MSELVQYETDGPIATITMDDGKANAFGVPMLRALHAAFDEAERDGAVVVLTGRPGYFSAGFDLNTLRGGDPAALREMVTLDASLVERILAFPAPVIAACPGHAYPAGAFLLLAADLRLGADGPFQMGYNEVRIGLTVPWFAVELALHRMHPAHADRALVTGELYGPVEAIPAGFLDRVLPAADLLPAAHAAAAELAKIDRPSHHATKLRVRAAVRNAVRAAISTEYAA
jgi:enoyl-CoA hydratase